MNKTLKVAAIATAALVVLGVGGPWVYINFVRDDAPERLTLTTTTVDSGATDTTTGSTDIEGTWTITPDTVVGYRVKEILFGQSTEGVGRTSQVEGSLTIERDSLTAASFVVDMASITSDDSRRDGQFRGSIMSTDTFPTAEFVLAEPIAIPAGAANGDLVAARAVGDLTLRGETRRVTFDLEARLTGSTIEVVGTINVVFTEWGIPSPSRPAITTEDNGDLEFRLVFAKS